jgi:hypothetical protein
VHRNPGRSQLGEDAGLQYLKQRDALKVLVETTPGVVRIEDHLAWASARSPKQHKDHRMTEAELTWGRA